MQAHRGAVDSPNPQDCCPQESSNQGYNYLNFSQGVVIPGASGLAISEYSYDNISTKKLVAGEGRSVRDWEEECERLGVSTVSHMSMISC